MLKTWILILGLGITGHIPEEPFLSAYKKQIDKELTAWSASYGKLSHLKTLDNREFYRISDRGGLEIGTLALSSAQGRFERFDLMVVIQPDKKLRLIRILKYRSEYGSEITNKKWLSQFYQAPGSPFVFRKNIDAISGATFSAQGLVDEINGILSQVR